jgi:hypothetical protein
MTGPQRSGFDPPDVSLHLEVGRLDGRLGALETRMDRHELETRAQLVLVVGKLDEIQTTLAERGGATKGNLSVFRWLLSAGAVAAAWFHGEVPHIGGH